MDTKKTILLKLTGTIIQQTATQCDISLCKSIAQQIKELLPQLRFGIVMGGGNFFRGAHHGKQMELSEPVGHTVGMLATMMNGLIIQDIFEHLGISTTLFSAITCNDVGYALSPQNIRTALQKKDCLIFAGGTGNPYFTTDTTAVLRALQIDAQELWKGTNVDGIYTADPQKATSARLLKTTTYSEALNNRLEVMDLAAFALAAEHKLKTRIFNIHTENALIQAATNTTFGSMLYESE